MQDAILSIIRGLLPTCLGGQHSAGVRQPQPYAVSSLLTRLICNCTILPSGKVPQAQRHKPHRLLSCRVGFVAVCQEAPLVQVQAAVWSPFSAADSVPVLRGQRQIRSRPMPPQLQATAPCTLPAADRRAVIEG